MAILMCVLVSCLWLIPSRRMAFLAAGGMLRIEIGKSAVLVWGALSVLLGAALGWLVREKPGEERKPESRAHGVLRGLLHVLLWALLFLTQAYIWGQKVYPNVNLEEIVFHAHMPLQGAAEGFFASLLACVILPILAVLVVLEFVFYTEGGYKYELKAARRLRFQVYPVRIPLRAAYPMLALWLAVLLAAGEEMLSISDFIRARLDHSVFIEEHYVSPEDVQISFPQKKRNLITVYLESMESTVQDTQSGGLLEENMIPELTALAQEHVSFSRSDKLEGARALPGCDYTIAALVAQTAGVPMKMHGTRGGMHDRFLPGVTALGDILKEQGYRSMFMAGSDFSFGGRRAYYAQHGGYEIYDLLTARSNGKLAPDYSVFWGFEDVKLYEFAKEELTLLAREDEPFHFAMLTVDTHNPGYRCPVCPQDNMNTGRDVLNYVDVMRCCSMQLSEFIAWCQRQPFYENTTIVVTGDHESMQDFFFDHLVGAGDRRFVYNAFINPAAVPEKENGRLFTTMDFFPTVLSSIGAEIEGDRLGLGTDLFSGSPTLSELYGEDVLARELNKYSAFYDEELLYAQEAE